MKFTLGFVAISSILHYGSSLDNKTLVKAMNDKKVYPKLINIKFLELWSDIRNDKDVILLGEVLEEIERGRGKSHKYKKLEKTLYPLFMGVLIAKVVLIPLILKMLTAVSSAALVMSKIALITTGLLALKWIFSDSGANDYKDQTHFELVYVHPTTAYLKPRRGLKYWDDQSWSDSNFNPISTHSKQTYIPVNKVKQNQLPYHGYGKIVTTEDSKTTSKSSISGRTTQNNIHHNSQHNYFSSSKLNDGKPFL